MGLFHPDDDLPVSRRLVGTPKASSSIHGEFVDTAQPPNTPRGFLPTQHPEQPDPRHDAQAAYDPEAMPRQYVPNPCEGADDLPPPSLAMVLVYGISALVAVACVAFLVGWLA